MEFINSLLRTVIVLCITIASFFVGLVLFGILAITILILYIRATLFKKPFHAKGFWQERAQKFQSTMNRYKRYPFSKTSEKDQVTDIEFKDIE